MKLFVNNRQNNPNINNDADNYARDWPHLPCYDIPDVSSIKCDGSMQFKKDTHIVKGIEWTVEGEWLNGVPHGVCIVDSEYYRGVFSFTHGQRHGGPSWLEIKDTGIR